MWAYVALIVFSIWILYNHLTVYFDWPVIMVGTGQWLLEVLAAMVLKWSLFFGVLGLIGGIAGLAFRGRLDERMDSYIFRMCIFYFFLSLCLIF